MMADERGESRVPTPTNFGMEKTLRYAPGSGTDQIRDDTVRVDQARENNVVGEIEEWN